MRASKALVRMCKCVNISDFLLVALASSDLSADIDLDPTVSKGYLITFANSLELDQNISPDLDPNCLTH